MANFEFTPENVKGKLLHYIKNLNHFLFNEKDLQIYLALELVQDEDIIGNQITVHPEYHIPKMVCPGFDNDYAIWGEVPSIDLVLQKGDKYIPVELKYKHKAVTSTSFECFGCKVDKNIALVTNQGAENEGRYDFWKDVKRLELLKKHFKDNVLGGIAIFLTNQDKYRKETTGEDAAFGMIDTNRQKERKWGKKKDLEGKEARYEKLTVKDPLTGEKRKETRRKQATFKDSSGQEITVDMWCRPSFQFDAEHEIKWEKEFNIKLLSNSQDEETFYLSSIVI